MNVLLALNENKNKQKNKKVFHDNFFNELASSGFDIDFNATHATAYGFDTTMSTYLRMLHKIDDIFNK